MTEQMEIVNDVAEITEIIREADKKFETVGGSTRHFVRDVLFPLLQEKGLCFAKTTQKWYEEK